MSVDEVIDILSGSILCPQMRIFVMSITAKMRIFVMSITTKLPFCEYVVRNG